MKAYSAVNKDFVEISAFVMFFFLYVDCVSI